MTVLSAQSIREHQPISSGVLPKYRLNGVSGGLSSCGYDISLRGDVWLIPIIRSFVVAFSWEQFNMPPNVVGIVHDKSTWARSGICVQNTVIEPGWRGVLAIELTLHCWRPRKIRQGTPIAQVVFHWLDQPTDLLYQGKYQDQQPGTHAIFDTPI